MPMGDVHDMQSRIESQKSEIFDEPVRKHLKGIGAGTSLLLGDGAAKEELERRVAAFRKESSERFLAVFRTEAEAQWDRIVHRRM